MIACAACCANLQVWKFQNQKEDKIKGSTLVPNGSCRCGGATRPKVATRLLSPQRFERKPAPHVDSAVDTGSREETASE
jgi:hypothetical protein